jgi:hypothetical protein
MEDDFIDDDDFGELYADLQLLPTPPSPQQQQHDDNDNAAGGNLNNDADVDVDAEADANDDYIGTDSDDDDGLKILLNDDDCHGVGVSVARDDIDDNVHGEGLGNNTEECIHDQSKFVSSDGYSKNGAKGGYGSQFFRSKVVII